MKPLKWFLILVLLLVAGGAVSLLFLLPDRPEPVTEEIPMMTAEAVSQAMAEGQNLGRMLSWGVIVFAVLMQMMAWAAAAGKFRRIKRASDMKTQERFQQLDAIEVYFDLPLYFGLLGTVLSFVVITLFPDAGLMFAYVSTALGIMVSVVLRVGYLTPYRQDLISRSNR